jgi:predicted Zn-dependent protease
MASMARPTHKKPQSPASTNGRRAAAPRSPVRPGLWVLIGVALISAVGVRLWTSPPVREWRYRRQPIEALQAAAEQRPGDPALRLALGRKRLAAGQAGEAAAEFRRAAALDPRSAAALTGLGEALAVAGQDDEAFGALEMSLAREPTVAALCAEGRLYLKHRVPEKAIPVLERAIGLAAAHETEPWRLLAGARAAVGQWAAADWAWSHVGSRVPGDMEALLGRSEALIQLGRPDEAEPLLRDAVQRQPQNPTAHTLLGSALAARQPAAQHAAPAEAEFRQALRLDPGSDEAAYGLALLLLRERRGAEAIPLLRDLLRRAPDSLRARFQYARALRETGRSAEADRALRDYHRRAEAARLEMELRGRLTLRPDDASLRARLARLRRESGREQGGK